MGLEKAMLANTIKKLERDLYKINNELSELKGLEEALDSVYRSLVEIKEVVADAESNKFFQEQIKDKPLIPLIKKMNSGLSALKRSIEEKEESIENANAFLENYRTQRTYSFNSSKEALDFIARAFELYAINSVNFKPEFVGTIDLKAISDSFGFKRNPNGLEVEIPAIEKLVSFLKKQNVPQSFWFDSKRLKVLLKNHSAVTVEAGNEKIRRLDHLCKELSGSYSD